VPVRISARPTTRNTERQHTRQLRARCRGPLAAARRLPWRGASPPDLTSAVATDSDEERETPKVQQEATIASLATAPMILTAPGATERRDLIGRIGGAGSMGSRFRVCDS